ncbi:DUF1566 domain-containing protein [Acidovorax sp. YS12]|nr:DUF1566 domain-containing protein [Acidovorax sp. YS12]
MALKHAALACLAPLAVLTAQAQDNCASPNTNGEYILGDVGTTASAMHWPTGLVWKRCLEGMAFNSATGQCTGGATEKQWQDWATDYLPQYFADSGDYQHSAPTGRDFLTSGDWRMAYKTELLGITASCGDNPKVNRVVFPDIPPSSVVWSGSPVAGDSNYAWGVGFNYGAAGYNGRDGSYHVRLVRGGQPFAPLAAPAALIVAADTQQTFTALTLVPRAGGSAWGGARIAGDGSPEFRVGSGPWVTEAIVKSGDQITVRLTAGVAGSTRTATLTVRSGETTGTNAAGQGLESTTPVDKTASFTLNVAGNGACGSADGQPTLAAPSANLCSAGTPSAVNSAAAANYTWNCAGLHGGTSESCSALRQYAVTATASPATGGNSAQCNSPVTYGRTTTCTATPGTGYDFAGWAGACSGTAACTPTVSGATAVTAQFSIKRYPATASASPPGAGTAACTPDLVPHGGTAVCKAAASAHPFKAWQGGRCAGQPQATCTVANVTGALAETAEFDTARFIARPLNDTGALACDTGAATAQDCHHGRDAGAATGQLTKTGASADARSGFDFTPIGDPLACTHDNVTGLTWEAQAGSAMNTYTWDVAAANTAALCGQTDWRLPTLQELETLVDMGQGGSRIDPSYFPGTPAAAYWTATPFAGDITKAWALDFATGAPRPAPRADALRVRLVRGGQ